MMSANVLALDCPAETQRLEGLLMRRLGSRIRDLRVILLPGGLILQGRTATFHAKQIAQHTAMEEAANLLILANEIEVQKSPYHWDATEAGQLLDSVG